MIYFIEIAGREPIKIGFTTRTPAQRLSQLQVAHPLRLRLLGACDGDREMEKVLHERFAPYRIRGEWYERAPEILDFIEGCSENYLKEDAPDADE